MGKTKVTLDRLQPNMMKINLAFLLLSLVAGIHGLHVETTPAREVCTAFECPNDNRREGSSSLHPAAQSSATAALVCRTSLLVRIPSSLMRKHRSATGVTTCATSVATAVAAHEICLIYVFAVK